MQGHLLKDASRPLMNWIRSGAMHLGLLIAEQPVGLVRFAEEFDRLSLLREQVGNGLDRERLLHHVVDAVCVARDSSKRVRVSEGKATGLVGFGIG